MPVTRNVAWDARLESFKGRDTTRYVLTAAGIAKTCAVCRGRLTPGEPMSLLVNVTQSTAPDGTEYLTFTDGVCHRRCSEPDLAVQHAPWRPEELTPVAARIILTRPSGAGGTRGVPVLAYTLVPVVSFRENGGELTSALVTLLLAHGFQLALGADFDDLLGQAGPPAEDCAFTVTGHGLIQLSISGETLYSEQLDPDNPDDAQWLRATHAGAVLVISGDNLDIGGTTPDLHTAAEQGTLVIGTVPVTQEP